MTDDGPALMRDDDAHLRDLAPFLAPVLSTRLHDLTDVGSDAQRVLDAEGRAQRAEDLVAEMRRQYDGMQRNLERVETSSLFVATLEPYHDNSVLIGVGRSLHHAKTLIRQYRIGTAAHNDIPYAAWVEGSATNTAEERPAWHAEHGGTIYQIVEQRRV